MKGQNQRPGDNPPVVALKGTKEGSEAAPWSFVR